MAHYILDALSSAERRKCHRAIFNTAGMSYVSCILIVNKTMLILTFTEPKQQKKSEKVGSFS